MLLTIVVIAAVIALLVIGGIHSQAGSISETASSAADKLQQWMDDLGVSSSGASNTTEDLQSAVPDIISTFVTGLAKGISGITSLVMGLSFAALSLFFLLKDGPSMRAWVDRHLGVPMPVARTITGNVMRSLRGYFLGVTIVAAFNATVVGLGALVLGVPLAGTIAVVTFVTAYIPYIGAFVAGAFAVILALGSEGTTDAVIMLVIVILANGLLQQLVQPLALGGALDLNPLVVLIVTIGFGSLFGMTGLVLAAPLTSAGVHISRDLARAREEAALEQERRDDEARPPPEATEPSTAPG
jgi:predicted PurR-regulated permease PerM